MKGLPPAHSLRQWARATPGAIAVMGPGDETLTFEALDRRADAVAAHLGSRGVGPGDRVAIRMPKTADAVAAVFGALRRGAAYVPLDPAWPAPRRDFLLADCAPKVVLEETASLPAAPAEDLPPDDRPAYLLYTSGSTGRPKGVLHGERSLLAFLDWATDAFAPSGRDRFASHAPFHFDLSVLDLFLSIRHGASLALIGEAETKNPAALAEIVDRRGITFWYSTPTTLGLLLEHGRLEERNLSRLRVVAFAGEVFPLKPLRRLRALLPRAALYNLYGPTETNVCTWYEVPAQIPPERTLPPPIGRPLPHFETRVVEGELLVAGAGVMRGYWNLPERTREAFLEEGGKLWYRTGDRVTRDEAGNLEFRGRLDRMVKRRGYRLEPAEVEACLLEHPRIRGVAVSAVTDDALQVRLTAYYVGPEAVSPIELKRFCSERLPLYLVPDRFRRVERLPVTATGKVDYGRLHESGTV